MRFPDACTSSQEGLGGKFGTSNKIRSLPLPVDSLMALAPPPPPPQIDPLTFLIFEEKANPLPLASDSFSVPPSPRTDNIRNFHPGRICKNQRRSAKSCKNQRNSTKVCVSARCPCSRKVFWKKPRANPYLGAPFSGAHPRKTNGTS